jgi:RNA polymerase sigma-70 factor, ECF subfamily
MSDPADSAGRHTSAFTSVAPDLLRFFERRVRETAPDLVAETFATAWRRHQLMPNDDVDARRWLFGIAHNVLRNARRSQVRRNKLADQLRAH